MCNARNHPPGCNCGWGQGWQSGGYGSSGVLSLLSFSELNYSREPASSSYSSLFDPVISLNNTNTNTNTNLLSGPWRAPNATCPVCGQGFYYCYTEHGGRFYFDELGPPWPKHACTGNVKNRKNAYSGENRWDKQGWQPLLNFTTTITRRDEGFLVRLHGQDTSGEEKKFFFRMADDVEFDICRFLLGKELTTISILAHNKIGELVIYEGFASSSKFYDLKTKDYSENIHYKENFINNDGSFEFFKEWSSKKPWSKILNTTIELISENIYRMKGYADGEEVVFQVRMDEFYLVRYSRFQIFGVSSAIVSLMVEMPENPDNFYVLEGVASIGKSFLPGKNLEIKGVLSKDKEKIELKNINLVEPSENIKIEFFSKIKAIDFEINELLAKISTLSQEKTKLTKIFLDQSSLLD